MTIFVIFYLIVIAILVVQLLGIVTTDSNRFLIIAFEFGTVLALVIFLSMLLQVAYINSQYIVNKDLLNKNKTIISYFSRLSCLYVDKDAIEPDSYIYKGGLKLLSTMWPWRRKFWRKVDCSIWEIGLNDWLMKSLKI